VVHTLRGLDRACQFLLAEVQVKPRSISYFGIGTANKPLKGFLGFCILLFLEIAGGNLELLYYVEVLDVSLTLL